MRHRLIESWRRRFRYLYEPFRVYDFAFDPTRRQRHRPAQLAGARLCLSPVHCASATFGLRYSGSRSHPADVLGVPMLNTLTRQVLPLSALAVAFALTGATPAAAQDAKTRTGSLRRAEVPAAVTPSAAKARSRTRSTASGPSSRPPTSSSGSRIPPEMATKAKSTKKPPMPDRVREACRPPTSTRWWPTCKPQVTRRA